MKANIAIQTIDIARLILTHWAAGETADQKKIMKAAVLNRAQSLVDLRSSRVDEACVPACWDVAINLARFTAFSTNLSIPTKDKEHSRCA